MFGVELELLIFNPTGNGFNYDLLVHNNGLAGGVSKKKIKHYIDSITKNRMLNA